MLNEFFFFIKKKTKKAVTTEQQQCFCHFEKLKDREFHQVLRQLISSIHQSAFKGPDRSLHDPFFKIMPMKQAEFKPIFSSI